MTSKTTLKIYIINKIMSIKELRQKMNQLQNEVDWWRTYGEYISRVYRNIDAEACGYADGDTEYQENFNQNSDNL